MGTRAATVLPPWGLILWRQIRPCLILKVVGTTAFMTVFFTAYINLLKNPVFPVFEMPLTAIDHLIGFYPPALLLYISLWFYVTLPPMLIDERPRLFAYGRDVALVCVIGLLCFLLVPTAVPPANIDWAVYPGMGFLKGVDAAGNACPSLHVATAVFSAGWLAAQLRALGVHHTWRWLNWGWCLGIAYSTLATKQHVALDVLAGVALGGIGAWLSVRSARRKGAFQR